jgi:hypothetical protein
MCVCVCVCVGRHSTGSAIVAVASPAPAPAPVDEVVDTRHALIHATLASLIDLHGLPDVLLGVQGLAASIAKKKALDMKNGIGAMAKRAVQTEFEATRKIAFKALYEEVRNSVEADLKKEAYHIVTDAYNEHEDEARRSRDRGDTARDRALVEQNSRDLAAWEQHKRAQDRGYVRELSRISERERSAAAVRKASSSVRAPAPVRKERPPAITAAGRARDTYVEREAEEADEAELSEEEESEAVESDT